MLQTEQELLSNVLQFWRVSHLLDPGVHAVVNKSVVMDNWWRSQTGAFRRGRGHLIPQAGGDFGRDIGTSKHHTLEKILGGAHRGIEDLGRLLTSLGVAHSRCAA